MSPAPAARLAEVLDLTGGLIPQVRGDQWTAPTPCSEWQVRALVDHLVVGNVLYAGLLAGQVSMQDVARLREGDHLGDRPVEAYRQSASTVVAASEQPGVLERPVTLPFGRVPGAVALHLRMVEVLVHGWDLAQAVGLPVRFPDDVVEQEIEFSRQALPQLPADRRPFGPSQPVPDDAPPIDRLAALLGRPVRPAASAGG